VLLVLLGTIYSRFNESERNFLRRRIDEARREM